MARLTGRDDDADTAAEAAREIERLRLTDAEREAIDFFVSLNNGGHGMIDRNADTLRKMLERNDHDAVPEAIDRTAGELGGARVTGNTPFLTAKEREAIKWYANFPDGIHAATLYNLLERIK
jgi:hypothetical protein